MGQAPCIVLPTPCAWQSVHSWRNRLFSKKNRVLNFFMVAIPTPHASHIHFLFSLHTSEPFYFLLYQSRILDEGINYFWSLVPFLPLLGLPMRSRCRTVLNGFAGASKTQKETFSATCLCAFGVVGWPVLGGVLDNGWFLCQGIRANISNAVSTAFNELLAKRA